MPDLPAIVMRVSDLARSISFFREGLDFTLANHQPFEDVATIIDKDGDALLLAGPGALDLTTHARPDSWELTP